MASFNLGRIRGDKGEKGDRGEKGEKGEKGDRGARGSDAPIPVFTIGETNTLQSSMEAYVELNNDDILNPVLNFSIPRGRDGKDASGDMNTAIYDTQGVGKDIFSYADALFDACLKKEGGLISGELKVTENSLTLPCVRNITVSTQLPENCANGDICIVPPYENGKKLGECSEGTSLIISEGETECEYIVVGKNYHGQDSVTLVRKNLTKAMLPFDSKNRISYIMSDTDIFLDTIYTKHLSKKIRNILRPTEIEEGFLRHCFLLSYNELNSMDYFSSKEARCAVKNGSTANGEYFTRTASNSRTAYRVTTSGSFATVSQSTESFIRPAIVLPYDTAVENTEYKSSEAVKLCGEQCGIYVFINGKWKECAA